MPQKELMAAKIPKLNHNHLFFRIKARLNQAFMFKALNKEELDIVIGAMAEKRVKAGENVI